MINTIPQRRQTVYLSVIGEEVHDEVLCEVLWDHVEIALVRNFHIRLVDQFLALFLHRFTHTDVAFQVCEKDRDSRRNLRRPGRSAAEKALYQAQ